MPTAALPGECRNSRSELWLAPSEAAQPVLLEAQGLSRRFGGVVAVDQVSLQVDDAELVGVIGPNGAGKSTLFHLITGHLRPDGGTVHLQGEDLSGLTADRRARRGM